MYILKSSQQNPPDFIFKSKTLPPTQIFESFHFCLDINLFFNALNVYFLSKYPEKYKLKSLQKTSTSYKPHNQIDFTI